MDFSGKNCPVQAFSCRENQGKPKVNRRPNIGTVIEFETFGSYIKHYSTPSHINIKLYIKSLFTSIPIPKLMTPKLRSKNFGEP